MHSDDELPEGLLRSTELLRDVPPVRAEWRRELQVHLDANASPRLTLLQRTRRWTISVPSAIAACLVCAVIGGAIARMAPSPVAIAPARATSNVSLPVKFDLAAPGASRVTIVGDFNQWNAESLPMRRSADGRRWEIEVRLPPGRYTYGFVVDGLLTRDPGAPQSASDDFGIPNSVLMVSRAGGRT